MRTTVILGLLFAAALIGGYFLYQHTAAPGMAVPATAVPASVGAAPSAAVPAPGTYTMAQVAAHGSSASCWAVISGNVYDLTAWIAQHPGGEGPILNICGKDGTSAFQGQHGSDTRANSALAGYKIGTLAS